MNGNTQTGQAAQPADVAVDELKEREVYESLVDEIVSGLNYLSVAERNVELSKMCKVRVEIIEKEIRNVDLANLKKSQKTSGGNRRKVNKNLPNVHLSSLRLSKNLRTSGSVSVLRDTSHERSCHDTIQSICQAKHLIGLKQPQRAR